jgi:hypothetical protein
VKRVEGTVNHLIEARVTVRIVAEQDVVSAIPRKSPRQLRDRRDFSFGTRPCENQFSHGLGHNGPPNHVRAGGSIFRKQPSLAGGRSRCRPASFIAPTRYRVDERRILMGMSAGGYGQRLATRLRPKERRAHVRHPNLNEAQSLRPQTLAMLPRSCGALGL